MLTEHWAQQIKSARKALGWTQSDLSKKSEVSFPFIQQIESGRANPSLKIFAQLLNALGLEMTVAPRVRGYFRVDSIQSFESLKAVLGTLSQQQIRSAREEKSVWGLLSALRDFYPSQWQRFSLSFPNLPMLLASLENATAGDGGRLKQRRMAVGKMAEYL